MITLDRRVELQLTFQKYHFATPSGVNCGLRSWTRGTQKEAEYIVGAATRRDLTHGRLYSPEVGNGRNQTTQTTKEGPHPKQFLEGCSYLMPIAKK